MLHSLSSQIRDCYAHAEACARKAEAAFNNEMREDFLRLEKSWLTLARSYEFAVQLADYARENNRRSDAVFGVGLVIGGQQPCDRCVAFKCRVIG